MKVYIAGRITGNPHYEGKFAEAERMLSDQGHIVLNPAALPCGMSRADYMRICFAMIDCADLVYFLPDWQDSPGAKLEHSYCRYIQKTIMVEDEA